MCKLRNQTFRSRLIVTNLNLIQGSNFASLDQIAWLFIHLYSIGLCVLWWSIFYLSLFLDWSCCVYQCWAWGVELASKNCHGSNSISGWRFFLLNLDYSCAYCGELLTRLFSLSWCPTYTGQVMSHLLLVDLNNTVRYVFVRSPQVRFG